MTKKQNNDRKDGGIPQFLLSLQEEIAVMGIKRILLSFFLLAVSLAASAKVDYDSIVAKYHPDMTEGMIYIDKQELMLTLFSPDGKVLAEFPVACGKNIGQKQKSGDFKTPEGMFYISQIQDASQWGHDFNDGKGFIRHAYGPWFMRLDTGRHKGIGIHGTHAPESIGTRATEGCIRLRNEDLEQLHSLVKVGTTVIITPDADR